MRDEHDQYERPRRHTRPRTKDRPDYSRAEVAIVTTVDRGRYTLVMPDDTVVTAMKSRPLGRQGVVVGDEVRVVGDTSGSEGSLARIVEVLERRTVLRRTADDDDPIERVVVANADQLVIVTALADPPPRPGLIDRCLVAAYDAGMDPAVCLTKADLAPAEDVVAQLAPLDVRVVATEQGGDLDHVRDLLRDRTSVLIGHSGVGKSTLVNALVPDAHRTTSHVNEVTGRGRHTSTSAMILTLPFGGRIVDTPGFRSFGLAHVDIDRILRAFADLNSAARDCPRGCTHLAEEPECALDDAAAEGEIDPARLQSFRRIMASRSLADEY
ncbi:ribosome small subunit-dependent GTPase A [Aeromicrobium sp.]|uniref:ribosome small subunit-dependent GTPase A n=1 Tax=Aeromicrobium sp. TaxID=1871063 RepID=UPI0028B19AD1|nr:ribosome small subunit-dependent GTPase A [Aeromicrobium sp.]